MPSFILHRLKIVFPNYDQTINIMIQCTQLIPEIASDNK